jgi:hypothetical protein
MLYVLSQHGLCSISNCKPRLLHQNYRQGRLTCIRNMSFTYSFPVMIQNVPAVAIPYQDMPDAEGMLLVLLNHEVGAYSIQHFSGQNAPSISSYLIAFLQ